MPIELSSQLQTEQLQSTEKLEKRPSFLIYFLIKLPISLILAWCAPGLGLIMILFISPTDPVGGGKSLYMSLGIYPFWWLISAGLAWIQTIPSFLFVFLFFIKSHFRLRMESLKILLGIWIFLLIAESLTIGVGRLDVGSKYNSLLSESKTFMPQYIPEGFKKTKERLLSRSSVRTLYERGRDVFVIDENKLEYGMVDCETLKSTIKGDNAAITCEDIFINNQKGAYYTRDGTGDPTLIYIVSWIQGGKTLSVEYYHGNNLTKEELIKVAESMRDLRNE